MSVAPEPMQAADLRHRLLDFARGMSTEITPHDADTLEQLAAVLPAGTVVYVAHPPKASLDDVVRLALRVEATGLRAAPHLVARRIQGESDLRRAAAALRDGGIKRVLVVAGDADQAAGAYPTSLALLESGVLAEAGVERVGVAGHPEGNRAIEAAALWQALRDKQAFAERAGLSMHVVTQFGFDPAAIHRWAGEFKAQGLRLPVHAGMSGPASLARLVKYAIACGVGASLRGAMRNLQAVRAVAGIAATPEEMLVALARGGPVGPGPGIVQPHVFAFGGSLTTARWVRAVVDGAFELDGDGRMTVQA